MDDSGSSSNDLDLNPDMMTTQMGVPTVVTAKPNPIKTQTPGMIDITPGAPYTPPIMPTSQHIDVAEIPDHKLIDITPDGPIAEDIPSGTQKDSSSFHLSDIVSPEQSVPELTAKESSEPLSEILKEVPMTPVAEADTSNPVVPVIAPEVVISTPPSIEPAAVVTELPGPSVTPAPPPDVEATTPTPTIKPSEIVIPTTVEESPSTQTSPLLITKDESAPELNPLYEDPDSVKLIK